MSIKILTKNSIDNTNIDGARDFHFNSGLRNGIVKNALNQGNFFASASNVIALDTCELRICGHRVLIDSAQYLTVTSVPVSPVRYSLIAEIIVDSSSTPTFSLFIQDASTPLIQNNLHSTTTGSGTYQMEIGRFTHQTNGTISDVVRTADLITGGTTNSNGEINIGEVVTNTLEEGMEAEVDVETRYDSTSNKTFTDFTFSVPKGDKGDKGDTGNTGATGAAIVSTVLQGQDANGGNIYLQTFDNGSTATFTAPKGSKGDTGSGGVQIKSQAFDKNDKFVDIATFMSNLNDEKKIKCLNVYIDSGTFLSISGTLTKTSSSTSASFFLLGAEIMYTFQLIRIEEVNNEKYYTFAIPRYDTGTYSNTTYRGTLEFTFSSGNDAFKRQLYGSHLEYDVFATATTSGVNTNIFDKYHFKIEYFE